MNNIARKPKLVPADDTDVVEALRRRIIEMEADDAVDLKLQIALEGMSGAANSGAAMADAEQAEAFLNGEEFIFRDRPAGQLATLVARRKVRALARNIATSRHCQLAAELAGHIWRQHFAEIAAIEKTRVLLAMELQKTNRAREHLREKIAAAGGAGYLTTDSGDLLGLGGDDEVRWAVDRLITDGIATRAEIEKAGADG